jgi:RNA polymerase sigma-70 factor (ECF subfamily)
MMSPITPEVLASLFDAHADALELYAAQWGEGADVVQSAFVQLAGQKATPDNPVAWLYRVVRNGAISAARQRVRRRGHERAAAEQAARWFAADDGRVLDSAAAAEALRTLPLEQREVIVARLWGGLSFEQVAEVVGISSSAAHRRYVAGLEQLRERLGVKWPTNG